MYIGFVIAILLSINNNQQKPRRRVVICLCFNHIAYVRRGQRDRHKMSSNYWKIGNLKINATWRAIEFVFSVQTNTEESVSRENLFSVRTEAGISG